MEASAPWGSTPLHLTTTEINSIKLGNVMGIPVRIHWTFFVMIYMLVSLGSSQGDALATLSILGIVFGSVFLHELGHCLMARRLGIRVLDITFWPLGGMARMSHMPEVARVEGLVAIAGPLVNFVLAAIGLACLPLGQEARFDEPGFSELLISINLLIGTFNLIPAFPMDGGRILRACLARNNDWVSATAGAVRVGRVFAGLMFFGSLLYSASTGDMGLCVLPLIAGFIWITGAKELLAVRLRHGQNPFGRVPGFAQPGAASRRAQDDPGVPTEARWHAEPGSRPGEQSVERAPGKALRPEVWDKRVPADGFSEEEIKRLENFHGRLDPRDDEDQPLDP